MISVSILPEVKPAPIRDGPKIKPGFIVTISGELDTLYLKSHAAFSARVLLFE